MPSQYSYVLQFAPTTDPCPFDRLVSRQERGANQSSLSRNSRCMRSTTPARAWFAIGLSALPNFTPLIAQLGSRRDFGVLCRTITPTKSSQPGAAFLTASKIANSSSGVASETRRSLRHHFFGGRAGACLISLGPLGFEDEEIAFTAVATFAGGFDKLFCMAQKMNALKFFAAIKIALPSLSSLVASCKISASIATQALRIKIQTNIVPSLRRVPPRPLQQISGKTATLFRRKTPKLDAGSSTANGDRKPESLRPVRIVSKRGAMPHSYKVRGLRPP
jgi:hypothetical protein